MSTADQRADVIREALKWLSTPFHMDAAIKGVGVDCGRFISATFSACGISVPDDFGHYAWDWHLHSSEERYLNHIKRYAHEIPFPPQAADIVLFKLRNSKVYSHGAIVLEWPKVIHAYWGRGVETADATKGLLGAGSPLFYSPWVR